MNRFIPRATIKYYAWVLHHLMDLLCSCFVVRGHHYLSLTLITMLWKLHVVDACIAVLKKDLISFVLIIKDSLKE